MLNRRFLRIKVFEAVYSCIEDPDMSIDDALRQFEASCEATRDLYVFLLSIARPLTDEAAARIEASRAKFNPTEEEKNPKLKFTTNLIAPLLDSDPDLARQLKRRKLSWEQYDVLLRTVYEDVREKAWFKTYLDAPGQSLKEDAALFEKIYAEEFEDNSRLEEILEDLSIYWNDSLGYALHWCCKTMKALGEGQRWTLPELYGGEKGFATGLLRTAKRNLDSYIAAISANTPKWDKDRICTTDLALICTGLAEYDSKAATPENVIINEYVEISKFYSTPESRSFVNGVLDKLIHQKNNAQ